MNGTDDRKNPKTGEPLHAGAAAEAVQKRPFIAPRVEIMGPLAEVTTQFAGVFSP